MASIRDVTSTELTLFGNIVCQIQENAGAPDLRSRILPNVVRLLRSDFGVSFVWNAKAEQFEGRFGFNVDPANMRRYDEWFQFRDPITARLRACRKATFVDEVMPRALFQKTEFFNDFLAWDGLHHGINMYVFDGDLDLGDFRIWRGANRPEFTEREKGILDALEPFLRRSLRKSPPQFEGMTPRERDIAELVAKGCTDRDIARVLGIGFGTVRTHLNRAMEKQGCANRAELAALVTRQSRTSRV
jgi:DNA-binding CsgD family transcriptional regulator